MQADDTFRAIFEPLPGEKHEGAYVKRAVSSTVTVQPETVQTAYLEQAPVTMTVPTLPSSNALKVIGMAKARIGLAVVRCIVSSTKEQE